MNGTRVGKTRGNGNSLDGISVVWTSVGGTKVDRTRLGGTRIGGPDQVGPAQVGPALVGPEQIGPDQEDQCRQDQIRRTSSTRCAIVPLSLSSREPQLALSFWKFVTSWSSASNDSGASECHLTKRHKTLTLLDPHIVPSAAGMNFVSHL